MADIELQGSITDAQGPSKGTKGHSFCPTCKRVMYSIWVYGPVTPAVYNTNFCVCDGRWEGWDAAEIQRNKEDAQRIAGVAGD